MTDIRVDKNVAAAVNRGLAAALLVDVRTGINIMSQEHVPAEVIARVILAPQSRRATDWRR